MRDPPGRPLGCHRKSVFTLRKSGIPMGITSELHRDRILPLVERYNARWRIHAWLPDCVES